MTKLLILGACLASTLTGMTFMFRQQHVTDSTEAIAMVQKQESSSSQLTLLALPEPLFIENLVVAGDQTIFAVEGFDRSRVFKIAADGTAYKVIATGLMGPNSIGLDSHGNLFVTEYGGNRVSKIDSNGVVSRFADVELGPQNIAIDTADNVYISYFGSGSGSGDRVSKITPAGEVSTFANIKVPNGMGFDEQGNLYVVTTYDAEIHRVSPQGSVTLWADIPQKGLIGGSATWANGQLFVATLSNNTIESIKDGVVTTLAGALDAGTNHVPAIQATFNNPLGIAYNAARNALYVTQYYQDNAAIRVIQLP